ncbi:hypothetical protein HDK90DRAFT_167910 [Phyllosticta capitalensis]|uniref:Uncharacterized protein n=1 Tax=Phyllosticta capitalensis TaxID=121624 RepID=A0ABR1YUP9_9PEZI
MPTLISNSTLNLQQSRPQKPQWSQSLPFSKKPWKGPTKECSWRWWAACTTRTPRVEALSSPTFWSTSRRCLKSATLDTLRTRKKRMCRSQNHLKTEQSKLQRRHWRALQVRRPLPTLAGRSIATRSAPFVVVDTTSAKTTSRRAITTTVKSTTNSCTGDYFAGQGDTLRARRISRDIQRVSIGCVVKRAGTSQAVGRGRMSTFVKEGLRSLVSSLGVAGCQRSWRSREV